jgi:putative chitinase
MDTKNLLERAKNFGFIKSEYYSYFLQYCDKYKINTSERISHFLAQVNYESGYMNYIEEEFTYSAKRLLQVFPKYFKTVEEANEYAYKPEKIANRFYANRMGNGDEASGDEKNTEGRGLIQLTGKNNYLKFSKWYNDSKIFVDSPDLLLQPQFAVLSAFFYWDTHKLNDYIVENVDDYTICKVITKKINGGYNGLGERFRLYKKIRELYNEFDKNYYE